MAVSHHPLRLTAVIAAAAVFASLAGSFAASAAVPTQSGLVEGVEENGALVFKGIPFAAPPVGPLRWRAPVLPDEWEGVRMADTFAPICPQRGAYPEDSPPEPMSEDCLYLNIWAPAGAEGKKLPVLVWVYGGGLVNGSSSTPLYWGDNLARRDVIVVTANYRIGALGFLAHPDFTKESANASSGNYGLLDQLAALQWVKSNIEAFGGDADNVTVFGQSSGSISISTLIASPLSRGLFRRAIGQSGGLFEPIEAAGEFKLGGAEQVGLALGEKLGAPTADALRALPVEEIVAARFNPQPNIDGYVLSETPYAAFANGRQSGVDVLVGSNEDEGLYFISGRTITAATLQQVLLQDFPSFVVSLIGPKPQADDESARKAFIAFESDIRFGWNMWA
jgi:para-nitrobenzyl esterase